MEITGVLPQWFINFLIKKFSGSCIKNENMPDQQLAKELHRQIIKTFKKRKIHSPFIDNTQGANLFDMQLINKFNKVFRFLLCVINIFSNYAQVTSSKDKKRITITNAFQKISKASNQQPIKIWEDKGSKFYNRSMKSWLGENHIEMHLIHDEKNLLLLKDLLEP